MLTITPGIAFLAVALVGLLVLTIDTVTSSVGIIMALGVSGLYWVSQNPPSLLPVVVGLGIWLAGDIARARCATS